MGKGRRYLAGFKKGAIGKEEEGEPRRGERAKEEKKEEQEVLEQQLTPTPTFPVSKPRPNHGRIVIDIRNKRRNILGALHIMKTFLFLFPLPLQFFFLFFF